MINTRSTSGRTSWASIHAPVKSANELLILNDLQNLQSLDALFPLNVKPFAHNLTYRSEYRSRACDLHRNSSHVAVEVTLSGDIVRV